MVQSGNRPAPGMMGIELKNIKKRFGSLDVLSNLSLSIRQAELCCLLGPSGCGKTTTLKIIIGLLEADEGTVYLLGHEVTGLAPQKRNLGMVFQNYALFPQMNVYDNIAYGLRRRRLSEDSIRTKVATALEMVRLKGIEKRRIHELSGGQQQRVALARALVIEPQALLMDEPLSNLDARLRAEMRDEIRRIQRQLGITAVYVTHDQEEAMSIADRIVVMNNGAIEQIGTPREIYENPTTKFVADFVGDINFIPGEVVDNDLLLLGCRYRFTASNLISGKVVCAIRPERVNIEAGGHSVPRGTVKEAAYFGSLVRYQITVNDEANPQDITVQLPVSHKAFKIGDNVGIVISYDDLRFLRDEP